MLLKDQIIKVKWNNANKKHYISKGYTFTALKDEFIVNPEDLPHASEVKVSVVCDNCGVVKIIRYADYYKAHEKNGVDFCSSCRNICAQITWNEKYGVSHPFKVKEIRDKSVATCQDRYGCDNPMQNDSIKEKSRNTSFERYGVYFPQQNEEVHKKMIDAIVNKYGVECVFASEQIKEKIKETIVEKYGVENIAQSEEVKQKIIETNMERYGVPCVMKNADVVRKGRETLASNGTCPTSKQQIVICDMVKDIYGNCELNYPCDKLSLDCFVNVDGILIDVEYDGWYWHKDKKEYDNKRNNYVLSQGYKILRIRSNYEMPTKQQIKEAIDSLINNNKDIVYIDLDIDV